MSSSSLEVPRRQRTTKHPRLRRVLILLAIVALAVGWAIWYLKTPDELPTSSRRADGTGVVGQDLYVGMWAVGDGFDRTIEISEVDVDVDADAEVTVTPQVCRGGTISVTTDASRFCTDLEDAVDVEFSSGDSIILVVSADEPTEVEIGRLEVSFSEGLRSSTDGAGYAGATLSFAEHDPADVEIPETDDDDTSERPEQADPPKDKKKDKKDGNDQQDQDTEEESAGA